MMEKRFGLSFGSAGLYPIANRLDVATNPGPSRPSLDEGIADPRWTILGTTGHPPIRWPASNAGNLLSPNHHPVQLHKIPYSVSPYAGM